jgi:hypothetical protein
MAYLYETALLAEKNVKRILGLLQRPQLMPGKEAVCQSHGPKLKELECIFVAAKSALHA